MIRQIAAPRRGTLAWLVMHRERMARLRASKRKSHPPTCRQCSEVCELDSESGLYMASCTKHLRADRDRADAAYKKKRKSKRAA